MKLPYDINIRDGEYKIYIGYLNKEFFCSSGILYCKRVDKVSYYPLTINDIPIIPSYD